jgi:hypothetical protein
MARNEAILNEINAKFGDGKGPNGAEGAERGKIQKFGSN